MANDFAFRERYGLGHDFGVSLWSARADVTRNRVLPVEEIGGVGTFENSPPVYRRESALKKSLVPGGTTETLISAEVSTLRPGRDVL